METSDVRRRVTEAIERAKRAAADRRARVDEAERDWPQVIEHVVTPLVRQVANVLKVEGLLFTMSTPSGRSVRLASERRAEDFAEVTLDTSGREPVILGRASRTRGGHVVVSERPIGSSIRALGEDEVLAFLIEAIEPMLER